MHRSPAPSGDRAGRPPAAVLGGDLACLRAAARLWAGAPLRPDGKGQVLLADRERKRDLLLLLEAGAPANSWPGGRLVWLWPERGPSGPDLTQLRLGLRTQAELCESLLVLVCLPEEVAPVSVAGDLDTILETLRWAVDPGLAVELQALWLSGLQSPTLGSWLANLR